MTTMTIVQSNSLQRPLVIFLVINAISIGSLTTIIIMACVFYDYNKIPILLLLYYIIIK